MKIFRHLAAFSALLALTSLAYADEASTKLADAVKSAKVSLATGLRASASAGKAISGKFELGDDGKLQLSVYTKKGSKFYEVAVDYTTGKAAKPEEITAGE